MYTTPSYTGSTEKSVFSSIPLKFFRRISFLSDLYSIIYLWMESWQIIGLNLI